MGKRLSFWISVQGGVELGGRWMPYPHLEVLAPPWAWGQSLSHWHCLPQHLLPPAILSALQYLPSPSSLVTAYPQPQLQLQLLFELGYGAHYGTILLPPSHHRPAPALVTTWSQDWGCHHHNYCCLTGRVEKEPPSALCPRPEWGWS